MCLILPCAKQGHVDEGVAAAVRLREVARVGRPEVRGATTEKTLHTSVERFGAACEVGGFRGTHRILQSLKGSEGGGGVGDILRS